MSDYSETAGVAVIIINYGTAELTIDAIESVLKYYRNDPSVKIHVVDNASPGDDATVLEQAHIGRGWGGQVTLHLEAINHGFGRGNNLVLRMLSSKSIPPKAVFLLNPDALLDNDDVKILSAELDVKPQAGFVGAGIRKPDDTAVSAAFRFPNAIDTFSEAVNFGPVARLGRHFRVALTPETPPSVVDWVSGAAVMIRFSTLQEVRLFDSDFFIYFEEVELMHRAALQGWQFCYVPHARIVHFEGVSTGVKGDECMRSRRPAYWYRSWYLYFIKTGGRGSAIIAGLARSTGASLNFVIAALRKQTPHAPLYFYTDFWNIALRPILGLKERLHGQSG